ncbi:MAG: zinc ribbon domain-containing protein [Bacillota bacterium]
MLIFLVLGAWLIWRFMEDNATRTSGGHYHQRSWPWETARCPHCGGPVQENFQVCPHCGQALRRTCPKCGHSVRPDWRYCPSCSTDLSTPQGPAQNPPPSDGRGSADALPKG